MSLASLILPALARSSLTPTSARCAVFTIAAFFSSLANDRSVVLLSNHSVKALLPMLAAHSQMVMHPMARSDDLMAFLASFASATSVCSARALCSWSISSRLLFKRIASSKSLMVWEMQFGIGTTHAGENGKENGEDISAWLVGRYWL